MYSYNDGETGDDIDRVVEETEADIAALQHAAEDAELRALEEADEAEDAIRDEIDSHYMGGDEQRFGVIR
jgi:hypothetical protein